MEPILRLIYLHGLDATGQGMKATLLRRLFPHILTPDFTGSLEERMAQLSPILGDTTGWTMVGSSFGGLMAAMFATQHPEQVRRLVLLAPALIWPDFAQHLPPPVDIPTVVIHGSRDEIVPLEPVQQMAQVVFRNLDFRVVDDDHGLFQTAHSVNWHGILDL